MLAGKIGYFRASLDPAAAAYIAAVEAADGQSLEAAVRTAINNFVVGCKADGIWSAIKASCILCGARTLSGALVPLTGTAPTNNNFVSGDYSRSTGLVGNKTTKYLSSNRLMSDDPLNSQHLSVFATTAATSAASEFPVYIGALGGDSGASHFGRLDNNNQLFFRSRTSTASTGAAGSGAATGFLGISRGSSSQYSQIASGSAATFSATSQTSSTRPIFVFASSGASSGVAATTYSNARLAFYSIGENVNLSLLSARVTTLRTAIAAAVT